MPHSSQLHGGQSPNSVPQLQQSGKAPQLGEGERGTAASSPCCCSCCCFFWLPWYVVVVDAAGRDDIFSSCLGLTDSLFALKILNLAVAVAFKGRFKDPGSSADLTLASVGRPCLHRVFKFSIVFFGWVVFVAAIWCAGGMLKARILVFFSLCPAGCPAGCHCTGIYPFKGVLWRVS